MRRKKLTVLLIALTVMGFGCLRKEQPEGAKFAPPASPPPEPGSAPTPPPTKNPYNY